MLKASDVELILDSLLCDTLAGLASADVKLDDYYDVYRIYKHRYQNAMIRALLNEAVYNQVTVDSQEVVDFYHSRPDLFSIKEQVMLFHILISPVSIKAGKDSLHFRSLSPEQFEFELEEYAHQLRRLIEMGMPFVEVARQYSHDTFSGKDGGLVGWTERGIYRPPFDSVAFSMEEGVASQPYQDRDGWHIIMTPRHMPEGIPPYDSAAYIVATQDLKNTKANEIGGRILDSVRSLPLEIVRNDAILDTNVYKVEPATWAAIINGTDTLDFNHLRALEETFRNNNRLDNTTLALKYEMIQELAKRVVMVQVARDMRIDTLPEVMAIESRYRHESSKEIFERQRFDHTWQPEESAVRAYYDKHIDEFTVKKPVEIQHIIAEDSTFAEFLRDQALSGVDFLQLAQEHYPGEPQIRVDLANLGYVGPGEVPDELYQAALLTPIGSISPPVKTQFGYHIVRVVNRKNLIDFGRASIDIVPVLRKRHAREVFEEYRDRLYRQFSVKFPNKLRPIHLKPLEYRSSGS
ncbi:MAG: peptidylprolyl isomerase [candidate division Zixibacteria bacterium]|nr:peptidylprolyl isomerase [candidate division Zixibacteria bacterium]